MNKSNKHNQEDQELHRFFDELKEIEQQQSIPDFEVLIEPAQTKKPRYIWRRYAAAIAVLVTVFGTYQWFAVPAPTADTTEIIISYEIPKPKEKDPEDLALPGIDQWQSETDILLTGL